MAPASVLGATVAAFGVLLIAGAAWGLATELPDFWDPCHEWGIGGESSGSYSVQLTDDCPRRSATSETKLGAATRLALVDGVAIAAGGLAVAAGWRQGPRLALAAGLLMVAETVVLFLGFSVAFLVAAALAALLLTASLRWRNRPLPS